MLLLLLVLVATVAAVVEAAAGAVALLMEEDDDAADADAGTSSLGAPKPLGLDLLALAESTTNGHTGTDVSDRRGHKLLQLECRRSVGTKAATLGAQKNTTKCKAVFVACLIWWYVFSLLLERCTMLC